MFVDYVQNLSDWVEKRPYWNRAVAYVVYVYNQLIKSIKYSTSYLHNLIIIIFVFTSIFKTKVFVF